MPTYEYACSACGHKFEEFQSIKAKPTVVCPKCKKRKVKRLISAGAGFIFKGSGFYITDYRPDSYKSDAKSDVAKTTPAPAPATPAASTTTPAKTETKPAAPAPAPAAAPSKASSHASKKSSKH